MLRSTLYTTLSKQSPLKAAKRCTFTTAIPRKSGSLGRAIARTTLGVLTASSVALATTIYADDEDKRSIGEDGLLKPSLSSVVRAYAVYSMCSFPWLVDSAPEILQTLSSIPVVKQVTEAAVRVTFFKQFVGADTAEECIPLLQSLRRANKGALFAYSVEVDENAATLPLGSDPSSSAIAQADSPHKRIVDETIHCVDVAADFEASLARSKNHPMTASGQRTWIAVKLTALLPDAAALVALSSWIVNSRRTLPGSSPESSIPFPGVARIEDLDVILHADHQHSHKGSLSREHVRQLKELYDDLVRICGRAKERNVKVIIDAEYSWYQPAIDIMTLALMREFNSLSNTSSSPTSPVQPLVYGTFQAYLRRTPSHLVLALADSKKLNYALGVKLVRGAYHPHEIAAHDGTDKDGESSISPDKEPPVWRDKRDTDDAYDRCAQLLIEVVKQDVERCRKFTESLASDARSPTPLRRRTGWLSAFGSPKSENPDQSTLLSGSRRPAPSIGVLFGTHNWKSCGLVLDEIVKNGLGYRVASRMSIEPDASGDIVRLQDDAIERITIGQLYGMCDDLSDWLVSRTVSNTPLVIKYVPYGALADVMPYLSRRATENKSVLGAGAAAKERRRAGTEIWQRLFG